MIEGGFCTCCGAEARPFHDLGPWRAEGPPTVQPAIYYRGLRTSDITGGPARCLAVLIRNGGAMRIESGIILCTVSADADGGGVLKSHMFQLRRLVGRVTQGEWRIPYSTGRYYRLEPAS